MGDQSLLPHSDWSHQGAILTGTNRRRGFPLVLSIPDVPSTRVGHTFAGDQSHVYSIQTQFLTWSTQFQVTQSCVETLLSLPPLCGERQSLTQACATSAKSRGIRSATVLGAACYAKRHFIGLSSILHK